VSVALIHQMLQIEPISFAIESILLPQLLLVAWYTPFEVRQCSFRSLPWTLYLQQTSYQGVEAIQVDQVYQNLPPPPNVYVLSSS